MVDDCERLFLEGKQFMDRGALNEAILRLEQALEKTYLAGSDKGSIAINEALGLAYHQLKDHDHALGYYKNNLVLYQDLQDFRGTVDSLNKIGQLLLSKGDLKGALQYHMKCLESCKDAEYKEGEATALKNIGIVHSRLGNHVLALKTHTASLDIKRNLGDRRGEALSLYHMGQSQVDAGEYDNARENLEVALGIFKNMGLKEDARRVQEELDEIDELEEDLDLELEIHGRVRAKKAERFPADAFIKTRYRK